MGSQRALGSPGVGKAMRLAFVLALGGCAPSARQHTRPAADAAPAEDATPAAEAPPMDAAPEAETDADVDVDAAVAAPATDHPALCARPGADAVRDVFCDPAAPQITSLRQLQRLLDLSAIPPELDDSDSIAVELNPNAITDAVVVLGHSTALAGQLVSPINPRVLLLGRSTFMAFQRGVQQVEIASADRDANRLNFYLITFHQACNEQGCRPGDLFTPAIERDWTSVELRDDEDLKNTPADCRQCHQRTRERPLLLMRELQGPWTHFFAPDPDNLPYVQAAVASGRDLVRDFDAAKGTEIYAGIPGNILGHTAGLVLQRVVDPDQPFEFDGSEIEADLLLHSGSGPRRSATWDAAFQAFKRGEQLALPHFEPRPTDPAKQAALTQAYSRYRAGELDAAELPDLADIFPDDPQVRAEIGLQTEPDATPAETLIQACGPCHNDVLDQSISRARFNVALARMDRAELELAIARIEQAPGTAGVMPPLDARQLDSAGRARLLAYLRGGARSAEDDAALEHAAALGMAKDPYAGSGP